MKDESFSSIGVHCRNCQCSVSSYREINADSRDQIYYVGSGASFAYSIIGLWVGVVVC